MKTFKNILFALSLVVAISSCSKEEDEIPLADPGVSSADFDRGYIGIRMKGSNSLLDSITYTNVTKGFTFRISPSEVLFIKSDTSSLLSRPLLNGNTGDDISCAVYVNTATELGVSFIDTIPINPVIAGKFVYSGKY